MGEHGGKTRDGTCRAAMGQLALDHVGHAALLDHDEHAPRQFGDRTAIKVDELRRVEAKPTQLDAVFVDARAVSLHLLDKSDQRTAEGDDFGERAPAQHADAHLKEIFSGDVGISDGELVADHQQRMRQCAEKRDLDRRYLGDTARIEFFVRAAQAVYPRRSGTRGLTPCIFFGQESSMTFPWARYLPISTGATIVLLHRNKCMISCEFFLFMRIGS